MILALICCLTLFMGHTGAYSLLNDSCTFSSKKCNDLPSFASTALLSQRDVAYNATIDQQMTVGLNVSSTLFAPYGYTQKGLAYLNRALEVGYRSLLVDAYWSDEHTQWQLCPVELQDWNGEESAVRIADSSYTCQGNLSLSDIYGVLGQYISYTDTNIAANVITMRVSLHRAIGSKSSPQKPQSLSSELASYFTTKLYTPANLTSDRRQGIALDPYGHPSDKGYPTVHQFLFLSKKRLLISVSADNSTRYDFDSDSNVLFRPGFGVADPNDIELATTINTQECTDTQLGQLVQPNEHNDTKITASWRTIIETSNHTFTNSSLQRYVQCGYSPIINTPFDSEEDLVAPIEQTMWGWAPGQPDSNDTTTDIDASNSSSIPVSYNCAALDKDGWVVTNCYQEMVPLCRVENETYSFVAGNSSVRYFEGHGGCPEGTRFAVPRTALQNSVAAVTLADHLPLWVDLSSIAVDDCWVSGGAYSQCPYHVISHNRNNIGQLASAVVVAFVLLVVVFLLRLDAVPLRKNRNRWRRLMNKYSQVEYQGVPA
uniref:Maintenance of telomere capping protein 6 n=1 Tax=Blastobotrys adeninivorans TaxID=409370 RepID=A0A060TCB9_BLAAD